jgi:hypothetical protein
MKKEISRKDFLKKLPLLGIAVFSGGILLQKCSNSKTDEDLCSDVSKLTQDEIQTRQEFGYVAKSPYPEKLCDNCELWIKPEEGKFCGGCEIMEGPIHPKGYCTAWAAMT